MKHQHYTSNISMSEANMLVDYINRMGADHEAALAEAVAKERGACACVADDAGMWIQDWEKKYGNVSIAEAIRARSAK